MIVIGIDPGTRCGWAVRYSESRWDSGTWDLRPRRFEGAGMRFLRARRQVREMLAGLAGQAQAMLAVEEVRRHLGVDAAHVFGGILAVVQEECEVALVPYQGIPVGTVKRVATGKGNASKAEMIAAANARWGLSLGPKDENEADARWIAEAAAQALGA